VNARLVDQSIELKKWYIPRGQAKPGLQDVPFIPALGGCFYDLAALVSTEEKGWYKTCKYTLCSDGTYEVTYAY
jgi:hypothetical protein